MILALALNLLQAPTVTPAQIREAVSSAPATRDAFDREMFDYPSSRFRDVHVTINLAVEGQRGGYLCGYVNGKNRMGAYVGWRQFMAMGDVVFISGETVADAVLPTTCNGSTIAQDPVDRSDLLTSR